MKIKEINDNEIIIEVEETSKKLLNHYLLINDDKMYIGEVIALKGTLISVHLIGEIINNQFVFGLTDKPSTMANVGLITEATIPNIISFPNDGKNFYLGKHGTYQNVSIYSNINNFFSSHFTILGGTGSGKSCSLARIIQNIFNSTQSPQKAKIILFDTYGEYEPSFSGLNANFKCITTDFKAKNQLLFIPPCLLDVDDLAILLNANSSGQLQILSKALELVKIFKQNEKDIDKIKNNIIARAILDILLSGRPAVQIRDQIFSILSFYYTEALNLDTVIRQPGYNRTLKNCLIVDTDGKLREMELLTQFFNDYLVDSKDIITEYQNVGYSLKDLLNAIDFALISEGILKSEKIYESDNLLKVRMHNLIESDYAKYFDMNEYITKEEYINELMRQNSQNVQILNFNISYVDARFAKNIVKIISKFIFEMTRKLDNRGTIPYHILLEEAHRYVQNDTDNTLLGYNIFERIAKEGRKYGTLLGLISQRPAELSETVLSQCNNYLIFKIIHPNDVEYIKKLIPYMTDELAKKVQVLPPGNCYFFGTASRIPTIVKIDLPNPTPKSDNVDISTTWY